MKLGMLIFIIGARNILNMPPVQNSEFPKQSLTCEIQSPNKLEPEWPWTCRWLRRLYLHNKPTVQPLCMRGTH